MNQQNLLSADAATRGCVFYANVGAAAAGRWFTVLPPPCDVGRNTHGNTSKQEHVMALLQVYYRGKGRNLQMTVRARKQALLHSYTALPSLVSNDVNSLKCLVIFIQRRRVSL